MRIKLTKAQREQIRNKFGRKDPRRVDGMRKFMHRIVYFPALCFWVPFAICYRLANKFVQEPRYMTWAWFNIVAIDDDVYDLTYTGD